MVLLDGFVCVLIVIIVYGMGIDCKDVKVVIYYGFFKNLEVYM